MKERFILVTLFICYGLSLLAQEKDTTYSTSFNLQYSINVTHSSTFSSSSIGGEWGLVVDHHVEGTNMGISASINYALLHIGFEGFTSPSEASEFGLLESSFGVWHYPLPKSKALKINLNLIHGLVIKDEGYLQNYNIPMVAAGVEYAIPIKSSLALAIGYRLKYFTLDEEIFGTTITNVLYFKVGIKN